MPTQETESILTSVLEKNMESGCGHVTNVYIAGEETSGPRGERGLRGEPGHQGERGLRGEPGHQGERGLGGEPGHQGERGLGGESGHQGERGLRGEPGPQGIMPTHFHNAWRATFWYIVV